MPRTGTRKRAPKLDIQVGDSHIDQAIPQDSQHCMIADALKEAIPTARRVAVDLATIRYTDPASGRRYIYLTPRPAQLALLDFDHGVRPEPFGVAAYAAQITESQAAKEKRRAPDNQVAGKARAPRKRAELIPNPHVRNGHGVPVKDGGRPLPAGPLARGAGANNAGGMRTGATRRFGLNVMGK